MAGFGRREVIGIAGIALLMGAWRRFAQRPPQLSFAPIPRAPGWEFGMSGGATGLQGNNYLTVGLEVGPEPLPAAELDTSVHHGAGETGVPVAVFSDYFCPYCRTLIGRLRGRVPSRTPIDITWHELPLLGPNSVLAARAAEAALLQNGYAAFYDQLIRDGFRPIPRYFGEVAERAGLNGEKLLYDMDGPEVAARLNRSASAAASLGIFATPGIAIGRKVVLGALDEGEMERLIDFT